MYIHVKVQKYAYMFVCMCVNNCKRNMNLDLAFSNIATYGSNKFQSFGSVDDIVPCLCCMREANAHGQLPDEENKHHEYVLVCYAFVFDIFCLHRSGNVWPLIAVRASGDGHHS